MDRTLRHLRRIVLPDTTAGESPPAVLNVGLIECLLGKQEPQWKDEIAAPLSAGEAGGVDNEIDWFGPALNDSQKEAIKYCLRAQHVACIHGPPGVNLLPLQ